MRKAILPVLSTLMLASAPVLANDQCPKGIAPGQGVVLSSPDGRKTEITWLADGRVRVAEQNPAAPSAFPRETITLQGLIGLEMAGPSNKAKVTYDKAVDGVFPLTVGKEFALGYSSRVEGQKPLEGRMTVAVLEEAEQQIGGCTYRVLLVARFSELGGGKRTPVRYDVYAPQLQAVLKSILFDEAGEGLIEPETFEFETIAAK